ncbi:SDR family NAD(P)-dependent oxidoreductase [Labrys monachus]|uniref:NAD(P)-dependent dehydrogenase (Short-subunit alcohol dehydrogenase family) n=1 Tax=Labrys monachus TaxID=217067 RepID=A0ABU0FGN9_9HYPH|nr:SDR family NAD(P)-dependent oxidoreductase [Labrys monachus]MDQ0393772.1 NAD(P)-dependent dehydrogenase (short-subunit alcohol dehydrogenase family) [Labrys monachus]
MAGSFDAKSTTDEVLAGINLNGSRVLVTGVSSGVGVETARALAAHGARVVGAARDIAKAESATDSVRAAAEVGGGSLELIELDLASLQSVRACADTLMADGRTFSAIIANAGVMATPFGRTKDGFETQFGTNHLGHFLLVNRIAPLIADNGRLVNLSSNGHRAADVDLDDPNFEHTEYDRWVAYGRSKTANALFAVEFDRRHRDRGVRACAVMPGVSPTGLARHLSQDDLAALGQSIAAARAGAGLAPMEYKTLPQMAATSVWAAFVADADEVGGRYLQDCQVAPVDDVPGFRDGVMSYALDQERAKLLWTKSEALVGERF